MKKSVTVILSCVIILLSFGTVGCKKSNDDLSAVRIWTVAAGEKILQDKAVADEKVYDTCELKIFAAKNEYEAGQIVLTARKNVSSYTVELSDLTSADGSVYSAKNVKVYNEKYTYIGAVGMNYYTETGRYPDALLPFEKAVEYGENKISAGNNQSLYIVFFIPENQNAAVYSGTVTVKIGKSEKRVPVTLKVFDTAVGNETHSKSAFSISWYLNRGEMDDSVDMRMKYAEFLAEYRLSGYDIFKKHYHTEDEINQYVELAASLLKNEKISSLRLPVLTQTYDKLYIDGKNYGPVSGVNSDLLAEYIVKLARRGMVEKVNFVSKLFVYEIDEPELWNISWDDCYAFGYTVERAKERAVQTLISDGDVPQEIIDSVMKIPNIVTSNTVAGDINAAYCPYFSAFDNANDLENYRSASKNGLWWYGCNVPNNPFPTYHIDDRLVSARLESWMRYDYGIDGNLYWAVDNFVDANDYSYTDDYYYTDGRTENLANGDGYLLYPGKPYGIDGPVSSIRLESIRDGLEEYELLYALGEAYAAKGFRIDSVLSLLTESLYSGSRANASWESFDSSRYALLCLSELASSKAGLLIGDVTLRNGRCTAEVYAENGYEPKLSGVPLSPLRTVGSGTVYGIDISLSEKNFIDLTVVADGKTYGFTWKLGGVAYAYSAEVFANGFTSTNAELTVIPVAANTVNPHADEGTYLQLHIGKVQGKIQDAVLKHEILGSIGVRTKKYILRFYNSGGNQYFRIRIKYANRQVLQEVYSSQLVAGVNTIEFNNVYMENWAALGAIEEMHFCFSPSTGAEMLDTVYFAGLELYGVEEA